MSAPGIFLDCGAYSAFTQGGSIDLADYIEFIKRNRHLLDCYLALDAIPGSEGRREWRAKHIERAAAKSHANQQRMKAAGLTPIPVFHRGERFKWLDRYLADGETHIALAPLPWGAHRHDIMRWLDDCFSIIDAVIQSPVKVHGLGVTSPLLLHRHAWTSVDSRTWLLSGAIGTIPVPLYVNNRPDYSLAPIIVSMTDRSRYTAGRNHIDELIGYDLDRVRRYLNEHVGIELAQARYGHPHRQAVWVRYFQGLAASCSTKIVFVTDTSRGLTEVLNQCGAQRRLLSYFELKGKRDHALADYVAGRMRPPRPGRPGIGSWSSAAYLDQRRLALFELIAQYPHK